MQNVERTEEPQPVFAIQVCKETPMLSVNPSAPSTKSAPLTLPVFKINVKIHARVFAVAMPPALLTTTTPSASVIQDIREILSVHATEKLHVRYIDSLVHLYSPVRANYLRGILSYFISSNMTVEWHNNCLVVINVTVK
jgi:hypothetical protein